MPPRAGFVASAASVLVLALLVLAGLLGSQEVPENILPTAFWVMGWVAVPLSVGVLGDWTGPANPFAAISRAAGLRPSAGWSSGARSRWGGRRAPRGGSAPAVYALVVVGELIVNGVATLPRVTAVALVAYALVCAAGGIIVGADAWTSRGEIFTVMLATWGRLGWWRFRAPGRRGFAGGLGAVRGNTRAGGGCPAAAGFRLVRRPALDPAMGPAGGGAPPSWAPGSGGYEAFGTLAFATLTTCTLAVFGVFAVAAGRAAGHRLGILQALTGLLPSLLPIAFGYLLAHYLQYVLINGQLMLPLLGNPVGSANWPLHLPFPFNDSYEVATGIMPTSVVWYVQMAVIVVAHIVAVVLAHRHLAVSAPAARQARRSEWPWLVAMVGYTMLSLWLLAQPLIEQPGSSGPS